MKSGQGEALPTIALFEVEDPTWRRVARQSIALYLASRSPVSRSWRSTGHTTPCAPPSALAGRFPTAFEAVSGGGRAPRDRGVNVARPGLMDHRKFRRLVALLGVGSAQVRGHLEMLWDSAYQNGDPYIGDQTDVELAAGWLGDPGVLCKALVECGGVGPGFIDQRPDEPTFDVHDLFDHAPEYVKSRWRMERKRRDAGARVRKERDTLETVRNSSEQNGKGYASPAPAPIPEKQDRDVSGTAAAAPAAEALTLTPPEDEPRPKGKSGPKPDRQKNPDVPKLILHYATEFKRLKGKKPLIEAADAVAATKVLSGRSLDEGLKLGHAVPELARRVGRAARPSPAARPAGGGDEDPRQGARPAATGRGPRTGRRRGRIRPGSRTRSRWTSTGSGGGCGSSPDRATGKETGRRWKAPLEVAHA